MIERQDVSSATTAADSGMFFRSVLAVAVSGVLASPAAANPTGPQVAHGNAVFSHGGPGRLNITNSPGTIINWQGFSIARGELTRFIQQNGASAVLNRVTGGDPSQILGSLLSNGRVFLINRNGIVFGESAIIDTAGFVASTLNISDADFLAGRMAFSGEDGATLENRGFIRVRPGGEVMLIAPDVKNTGLIHADDGSVLLAAGRDIVIESMDFEHVRFRVQAPDDEVLNLGRIVTTGGVVALFAGTLRHDGVIEANRVSRDSQGRVRLHAAADASVGGRISAAGQGIAGGDVAITGARVELTAAGIDVSGDTGGGRVRIGGDYQGKGDLPRSNRTLLDGATRVTADARTAGDGGEIIVWSDGDTDTYAQLSARGGPAGGDGGLVETSGKRNLAFGPPADVGAPAGRGGTWLLDPEDITIGTSEAASISTALNGGSSVSVKTSDEGDGEGNIAVNSAISKTEGPDAALSMDAHNRIDVNAPITSTAGKLDVSLKAGRAVHLKADVKTNGGSFSQVVTGLALEIEAPEEEVDGDSAGGEENLAEAGQTEGQSSQAEETVADSGSESTQTESASSESETSAASSSGDSAPDASNSVVAESSNSSAPPSELPEAPEVDTPEVVISESAEAVGDDVPDTPEAPELPETPDPVAYSESTSAGEPDPSNATASSYTVDEDPAVAFKADLEVLVEGNIDTDGGDVHIDAGREGDAGIFGDVDASSDEGEGGTIHILGKRVGVYGEATVDASGKTGGGTVLVGGGQQGQNPEVPNARAVFTGPETTIRADATGSGDGGKVVVYADHTANILGKLSARGGPDGGDGGFVETSGRINLNVERAPDTRAPNGRGGTWLIDPTNITIVAGDVDTSLGYTFDYTNFYGIASGAEISVDTIHYGLSYGGTVSIHTSYGGAPDAGEDGNITWMDGAVLDANGIGYGELGNLYLYADNDINFYGRITTSDLVYGGIGNLKFIANADDAGGGNVNILGGNGGAEIDIEGNFTATGANVYVTGGDDELESVQVTAGGEMYIDADGGDVEISGGSSDYTNVFLFSRDNMTIRGGNVRVLGGSGYAAYANVVMSHSYTDATEAPFPTATQYIHAVDGDIEVRGGTDQYARAGIYAYQNVGVLLGSSPDDTPPGVGATLEQKLIAGGDIVVAGGSADSTQARVKLTQTSGSYDYKYGYFDFDARFNESFDVDIGNIPGTFNFTLNAVQTLDAGGNVNVLGGSSDTESASATVEFDQFGYADLFSPTTESTLTFTFDGGQFVDANGDIDVLSGQASGSVAAIDPTVALTAKYSSSSEGGTIEVQVDTYQRIRAGVGSDNTGSLNIVANGDDASVSTGGYEYYTGYFYGDPLVRVQFGTDQQIEADSLKILSESTNGAVAEIALVDGSNLDGYGSSAHTQTINIGGDALMRSANGGIARILNDGLNGSTQINGDFDFHEGVDGGSLTEIQLSNLVDPAASGSVNVLGDTNISGSPSVTGNGGVVLVDVTGEGSLDAQDVTVNGTLAPGSSPGVLFFPGNLTLGPGSNTLMEIGGPPGSGLFDQIDVGGTANLAGTMTVVLINGFTPNGVLVYDLVNAGTLSGGFSAFSGPGFSDGQNATTYFVSSVVTPPVTPPPGPVTPPPMTNTPPGPNPPFVPPMGNGPPPNPPDPFKPVLTFFDPQPDTDDELEERRKIGLCTASNTSWYMPIAASNA